VTSLLLDTHIALWWLADDPRLSPPVRRAVDGADTAYLSAASTWEVAIKIAIGKLTLELPDGQSFATACSDQGFSLVPVTHEDAWAIGTLPDSRTDPFDRLIAATARRRGWTVVTEDPALRQLGIPHLPL